MRQAKMPAAIGSGHALMVERRFGGLTLLDQGFVNGRPVRLRGGLVARWALVTVTVADLVALGTSRPLGPVATVALVVATVAATGLATVWRDAVDVRAVALAGAVLCVVAVAVPPRRSADLWAYAAYGSLVVNHHVSPYTHRPAEFPHDPMVLRMDPGWRHSRSVYGPVFTGISALTVAVTGARPLAVRLVFQAMAAVAVASAAWMLRERVPPGVLAAVVAHPIVVLYTVNGGHNDALLGLALLAAAFQAKARPALAGVLAGLAVGVKIVAAGPAAGLVLWLVVRGRRGDAAAFGAAVVAVAAVGYLVVGPVAGLRPVLASSGRTSRASVWELAQRLVPAVGRLPVGMCAAAGVGMLGATSALRASDMSEAISGPALAYLFLGAYVLPWYALWALAPAALARPRWWNSVLVWAAATVLAYQYVPGGAGPLRFAPGAAALVAAGCALQLLNK